MIPPGLTSRDFSQALREFRRIVGDEWVFTGDDVELYRDAYSPLWGEPDEKYRGLKPAVLEDRTDFTPEIVKYYVRHGAGIMPFLRKTELSDADLDAIAAYLCRPRAARQP